MVDGFLTLAASLFLSPQHRLRKRVNYSSPACAALVPAGGGADEDLARTGSYSPQHGTKIFLADNTAQSESFGAPPIPLAGNAVGLGVIVVLGVFLLIVGLGLADAERALRHYQHGLNPLSSSAGRCGPQRSLGPAALALSAQVE